MTAPCSEPPAAATLPGMPTRKPSPIQAVSSPAGFRLVRPGARYAVHRKGEAHRGEWLAENEALPKGWADTYPENEARALLPFLRALGHGRKAAEPTTPDGKLVARACKRLGLTAAALAETIGAHESVLSRARHGELPKAHRDAITALLKGKAKGAS